MKKMEDTTYYQDLFILNSNTHNIVSHYQFCWKPKLIIRPFHFSHLTWSMSQASMSLWASSAASTSDGSFTLYLTLQPCLTLGNIFTKLFTWNITLSQIAKDLKKMEKKTISREQSTSGLVAKTSSNCVTSSGGVTWSNSAPNTETGTLTPSSVTVTHSEIIIIKNVYTQTLSKI